MAYSKEITALVAEGSKAYSGKDYEVACDRYSKACETFQQENNRDDPDLLFLYGKALYQLAVATAGVLGAEVATNTNKPASNDDEETENSEQFQLEAPMAIGEEVPQAEEEEEEEKKEEANDEANDENEAEEEPENGGNSLFEEAWDVLEMARSVWQKDYETNPEDPTALKKLAEVYDLLGEVSLEAENFPQLLLDFKQCLEFRQKICKDDPSNELVVEATYKIALSEEYCGNRDLAITYLDKAIALLAQQDGDDAKMKQNKELIQDLTTKKEDIKRDQQDEEAEQMAQLKGLIGEAFNPLGASAPALAPPQAKAVNDLTGMVKKRKAKPSGGEAKKAKK